MNGSHALVSAPTGGDDTRISGLPYGIGVGGSRDGVVSDLNIVLLIDVLLVLLTYPVFFNCAEKAAFMVGAEEVPFAR
jgi:hypothetical protein